MLYKINFNTKLHINANYFLNLCKYTNNGISIAYDSKRLG